MMNFHKLLLFAIFSILLIPNILAVQNKGISIQGLERTANNYSVLMYIPFYTGMQSNFSDLRFKDGTTNLSFYLENYSSSTYANVWVKIPTLNTIQKNITMEYDNGLSSASSFNNAFMFGDDFSSDTGRWINNSHAKFNIINGVMNFTNTDGSTGYIYPSLTNQLQSVNYTVEASTSLITNSLIGYGVCGYSADFTSITTGECNLLIHSALTSRSITRMGVAHASGFPVTFLFTTSVYYYQSMTLINGKPENKIALIINGSTINNASANDVVYTSGYYGFGSALEGGSVDIDWFRVRPYSNYMPNVTFYNTTYGVPDIQYVNPTDINNHQYNRQYILVNVTSNNAGLDNITIKLYNSTGLYSTQTSATSPFYYNFSVNLDGNYKFNATACNPDNCNSTATRTVLLDTFNPVVSIEYPDHFVYYNAKPTYLNITAFNTGTIEKCWFSMNNGLINTTFPNCTEGNNNIFSGFNTYVGEGLNQLRVWANDTVGLYSQPHLHNFTVDTINPTIQFNSPTTANSTLLLIRDIIINVTANDINFANLTITLYNDSGSLITVATTDKFIDYNFSGLSDGDYYFNATVTDLAGRRNYTETRTTTINSPLPTPTPSPTSSLGFASTMADLGSGLGNLLHGLVSGGLLMFIILIAIIGGIVAIFYSITKLVKDGVILKTQGMRLR